MKFVIAVALLCIGSAIAQTPAPAGPNAGAALVESLEKRADALLARVRAVIQENRQNYFLVQAIDHQAIEVEALALDLKNVAAQTDLAQHLHHLHTIEEELLFLENRVSEEIAILQAVQDPTRRPQQLNATQLITIAEQLIKQAHDAVAKYPNAKEIRDINSEIIVIGSLVKAIQNKPTSLDLVAEEQELARHETSLTQLIARASARQPAF